MSDDSRGSLHVITFMGLAAAGTVVVLMMFSLQWLEKTEAGTRARIAAAVKEEYKAQSASAEWHEEGEDMALRIAYVTDAPLSMDQRDAQMRDCAQFVYAETQKYDDKELFRVRRVDVTRVQVSGSGCFQSRFESKFSLELPKRLPSDGPGRIDPQ